MYSTAITTLTRAARTSTACIAGCLLLAMPSQHLLQATEYNPDPAFPGPLAEEVQAVIRIADPLWLFDQTSRVSSAMEQSGAQFRNHLAALIYGSASLKGIDINQPVVLGWRRGDKPLVAVIPLSDRREFLRHFGRVTLDGRMLIRVGERDGTIVYSKNSLAGIIEYRLMIRENVAYLAGSVEECELMAAVVRPQDSSQNDGPAVTLRMTGTLRRNKCQGLFHLAGSLPLWHHVILSPNGTARLIMSQRGWVSSLNSQVS